MKTSTIILALAAPMLSALPSCDLSHASQDPHANEKETERSRPTNQVAVMTVWAEAEKIEATAKFYDDVLGLKRKSTSTSPYILDTDGTFVAIMEGKLESPHDPKRRWPMFALSVPDLDEAVKALREAKVELPWGIEEFGSPKPSSRYVMFNDPAGNLIEIVQWL
ncbi:MAG: VOC family protein [bacterium]|nr:VOC family protein [bacterium]